MNPQIWWYIARASGIIAWVFLTVAVLWGIFLSTDLLPKQRRPAWLLDLHRALGGLSVFFLATHVGALLADSYIQFSIVDLLVPFTADWKTWQVALGVFALWGVVIVEATSLAMKHLPRKIWRGVHFTSYVTFVLASLHGTFAGTDAANRVYAATSIFATLGLVFALSYRILTRRSTRSSPSNPSVKKSASNSAP